MASMDQFRKRVVRDSLFAPCGLAEAVRRLGFVQADPIRCPARAQDLILRHRVKGYRAGDLEQAYPTLGLEECFLYAYGFGSQALWQAVHPRSEEKLSSEQEAILDLVREEGEMHPKTLEERMGGSRTKNYWGGYSRSAKMALESLHHRGALRISRREKGIRIYAVAEPFEQTRSPEERFKELVVATVQALGPMSPQFLLRELAHFKNLVPLRRNRRAGLQELIDSGRMQLEEVDGGEYVSLAGRPPGRTRLNQVRFLAPFDPIVRDGARFEKLWGWTYRFEAYTPPAKRKMGYYALPVLWQDQVVGWANAKVTDGRLDVDLGYVSRPKEAAFAEQLEREVARMATFLGVEESRLT